MGDERIDLLRNTSIFAAMTPESLELLLRRARRLRLEKGGYFFREGGPIDWLSTVYLGTAAVLACAIWLAARRLRARASSAI